MVHFRHLLNNKILILLTITIIVHGCKKEECFIKVNRDSFVSVMDAKQVATNFNFETIMRGNLLRNFNIRRSHRKVKEVITLSCKNNPYLYIFNYEKGGYVIVPADNRLLPIITFSETGCLDIDSLPDGLRYCLELTANQIKKNRDLSLNQSDKVKKLWDIGKTYIKPTDPNNPENDYSYYYSMEPLLKTQWHQGCGFNTYCPSMTEGDCQHAYAGCGTIAVAQVMAYWKYPSTYHWDRISNIQGSDEAARLIGDLFPIIIDSYDKNGSSCKNDYNLRHAFLKVGYKSASLAGYVNGINENGGYDFQKVISNLNNNQPVILGAYSDYKKILFVKWAAGKGHLWVCDGYSKTVFTDSEYLYFHMNWGQGGNTQSWVAFNNWDYHSIISYNYFQDMIFDIHP